MIGDVPDDQTFSIFYWLRLLFAFHGERRPDDSPFFVHVSRDTHLRQPLTYSAAMTQFRRFLRKVTTAEEADSYGLHGLRVAGWNGARRGPAGDELAVAHGGWHGGSQHRYEPTTGLARMRCCRCRARSSRGRTRPCLWGNVPPHPCRLDLRFLRRRRRRLPCPTLTRQVLGTAPLAPCRVSHCPTGG